MCFNAAIGQTDILMVRHLNREVCCNSKAIAPSMRNRPHRTCASQNRFAGILK